MMQRRTRATCAGGLRTAVLATLVALSMAATSLPAAAEEPLKIGFGMAETGPLAGTGKSALLAMTIWAEDVNAKGGLLGRQSSSFIMTIRAARPTCRRSMPSSSISTRSI